MKKEKVKIPKLMARGKKKILSFRMRVDGKDRWISTHTADKGKAEEIAKKYVQGERDVIALSKVDKDARKMVSAYMKRLTGKEVESLKLSEAHDKWISQYPDYMDLSQKMKDDYASIFKKFSDWTSGREPRAEYIDQVDHGTAKEYSKYLWESHLTVNRYNKHIAHLSRVFSTISESMPLPFGNPFGKRSIIRKKSKETLPAERKALEPDEIIKVISKGAEYGRGIRDLLIVGLTTGLRLKDACLLKWKHVDKKFIDLTPSKTKKTSMKEARIPISATLAGILAERKKAKKPEDEYVIPEIARHYLRNPDYMSKKTKKVFEDVFGKDATVVGAGVHRNRTTSVCSFHSFRTTLTSLLLGKRVEPRDAKRILAWKSDKTMKEYERELVKAQGEADARAMEIIGSIEELKFDIPDVPETKLTPSSEALKELVVKYSNVAIGKIYGISDVAVKKWMKKFGIERTKRIESPDIGEKELEKIRKRLKATKA